jgi:hypothetical protein
MTFARRKKEDLAYRVHAMPAEAVLALAMDCFGWGAPGRGRRLVWLVKTGLPMAYAEEVLSTRPRARIFLEKKPMEHTMPLFIDCPAHLRL